MSDPTPDDGYTEDAMQPQSIAERLAEIGLDLDKQLLTLNVTPGHFHTVKVACAICGDSLADLGVISTRAGAWVAMDMTEFLAIMGQHVAHVLQFHSKGLSDDANSHILSHLLSEFGRMQGPSGLN